MKRFNTDHLARRIIQYVTGTACIAFGIVLIKHTKWGVTPVSAIPDSIASATPLTIGNAIILFCFLCIAAMMIIQKKVSVRAILAFPVSIVFGYLVDLFMLIWKFDFGTGMKIVELIAACVSQAFGICMVAGTDLIFPAPDELNRTITKVYGKKLSLIKNVMDAVYVVIAIIINLITLHTVTSIGISSVVSVLLTGRLLGLFLRVLPGLQMEPFFMKTGN